MRQERFSFLWVGLVVVLVAAGFAGLVWLNRLLVTNLGGGETLFSTWYGVQGFLFDRLNPYDLATIRDAQQTFGQGVTYPYIDIPFYILLFNIPIAAFTDFMLARVVWSALAEIAIVTITIFNLRLTEWHLHPVLLGIYLVFTLFSVHTVLPFLAGDPIIWLTLLITLLLWALRTGSEELAGALLAMSTFKWEVVGLFLLFVFVWVFAQRRWRVLAGFAMSLIVMVGVAFLFWPGWFLPFLGAALANLRAGVGTTPASIISGIWPGIGKPFGGILTGILTLILILEWVVARRKGFRHFLWAACLTLSVSPLIGLESNPINYLALYLPLTLFLAIGSERWMRAWGSGVVLVGLLLGLWFLFWKVATSSGSVNEALFFPMPMVTIIGLYWVRWWAVRAQVVRPGYLIEEGF